MHTKNHKPAIQRRRVTEKNNHNIEIQEASETYNHRNGYDCVRFFLLLTENISYFYVHFMPFAMNPVQISIELDMCVAYHKYTFIARAKRKKNQVKSKWQKKHSFHILDNMLTFFHNRKNSNDFCAIINL